MTELTLEELAELERLHAAATPGEWAVRDRLNLRAPDERGKWSCPLTSSWLPTEEREANFAAIAALHNAAPQLLALARRTKAAEAELAEAKIKADDWDGMKCGWESMGDMLAERTKECNDLAAKLAEAERFQTDLTALVKRQRERARNSRDSIDAGDCVSSEEE